MSFQIRWIALMLISMLGFGQSLHSQHYFFIEADGQQPFYIRWNEKLLSSSASGFLLVPSVMEDKMLLTIGFPMNKYAEQHYDLEGMDRDRGFQLKNFGEKGWGLFDRTSLSVIMPVNGSADKVIPISKPADNSFAAVLAEVTGDSALMQKNQEATPPHSSKKELMSVSTPVRDSLIKDDRVKKDLIISMILQENDDSKIMGYLMKSNNGKIDTIFAEIIKPKLRQLLESPPNVTQPEKDSSSIKASVLARVPVCDKPFAEAKDIRSLQRKILGLSDAKVQISAVVKAYKERCYNSRQTMDLGWMVTEEAVRLQLFEALKGLVSDPNQFGQLEAAFMKEENVAAFRKLMGKN